MPSRPLHRSNRQPILSTAALFAGSALIAAALLSARPRLTGIPSSWSGDDVASATTWLIAMVCATWLAVTTLACLCALARGEHATALRIAAFAPPLARRVLQATLVTTVVLLPTAAYATSPPPRVLHVSAQGRLTTLSESAAAVEIPVVRAPPPSTPTPIASTSAPTEPATTAPAARRTTPVAPTPTNAIPPIAPVSRAAPARTVPDRTYVVRAGDNLWRIAGAHVARTSGGAPSDETIARYWQRVIAANRTTLRSGNPSLIFPGEVIALPLD